MKRCTVLSADLPCPWFTGFGHELKDLIMTVLLEPRTLQRGYFNPEGVQKLLHEHFRERRDYSAGNLAPADL